MKGRIWLTLGGRAMPLIPNFPQALLQEHAVWHHTNHVMPGTVPPRGFGERFLQFHRDYINRVYNWYGMQGYDRQWIAAWPLIPAPYRQTLCYGAEQL